MRQASKAMTNPTQGKIDEIFKALSSANGELYKKLHDGKLSFEIANARMNYNENTAKAQLLSLVLSALPEKQEITVRVMGYDSFDDAVEHGKARGHNQAIDQVVEVLTNLLKGGE